MDNAGFDTGQFAVATGRDAENRLASSLFHYFFLHSFPPTRHCPTRSLSKHHVTRLPLRRPASFLSRTHGREAENNLSRGLFSHGLLARLAGIIAVSARDSGGMDRLRRPIPACRRTTESRTRSLAGHASPRIVPRGVSVTDGCPGNGGIGAAGRSHLSERVDTAADAADGPKNPAGGASTTPPTQAVPDAHDASGLLHEVCDGVLTSVLGNGSPCALHACALRNAEARGHGRPRHEKTREKVSRSLKTFFRGDRLTAAGGEEAVAGLLASGVCSSIVGVVAQSVRPVAATRAADAAYGVAGLVRQLGSADCRIARQAS